MSNQVEPAQLFDEATEWVVRLRSPAADTHAKSAFSHWLNQSPAHEAAFDAAIDDWQLTTALRYSPQTQKTLSDYAREAREVPAGFGWLRWQPLAAAALLLAVIVGSLQLQIGPQPDLLQEYATSVGEFREIELTDGSRVKLNTNSRLRIEYREDLRLLTLERGEAFFRVASNRQRPFVVETQKGTVTAVGTAFAVNQTADSVDITVIEGIVSVKERQVQPEIKPESRLVKADEQLKISQHGLTNVVATNAARALAWREQLLVLENKPLPEAIAELNRYLDKPVDASDPALSSLRVSGTFSLQTPRSTLDGLVTSFSLALDETGASARLYRPTE